MAEYSKELWLGRGDGYWNWEFKGVGDSDFFSRVAFCEEVMAEVKLIRDYYQHLIEDSKVKEKK